MTALPVQAEEDKWIDGIKIRYGESTPTGTYTVYTKNAKHSFVSSSGPKYENFEGNFSNLETTPSKQKFPVVLTFKETLTGTFGFRGFYMDWSSNEEENMPSQDAEGRSLINEMDNATNDTINWIPRSASVQSKTFTIGYGLGVFIPTSFGRFLKTGLGLGLGYLQYNAQLYDCNGGYQVTISQKKGECLNKEETDSSEWKGFTLSGSFTLNFYEIVTENYVLAIYNLEGSAPFTAGFQGKTKKGGRPVEYVPSLANLDYISFTWRF